MDYSHSSFGATAIVVAVCLAHWDSWANYSVTGTLACILRWQRTRLLHVGVGGAEPEIKQTTGYC